MREMSQLTAGVIGGEQAQTNSNEDSKNKTR